ncbi:acyl-CoA dehydrogenase family protein [Streptomyces sp. NEAU-Y11]|uniref:acyl-CoA dehydrogenase family protein n=1 Tax=Streptomyces cucumeris TaxID=2962890 RepID=UPI0020C8889E|nr:acyl-CoA dehydrogenase family protein [Streptomyces sp. NEAU-Y11]MCP9210486.1 hypothetical protein [Streptomyces sp. NEAU-Y11]
MAPPSTVPSPCAGNLAGAPGRPRELGLVLGTCAALLRGHRERRRPPWPAGRRQRAAKTAKTGKGAGRLSSADTAEVKWWTTELQVDIANRCLQIHGGHGYLKKRSPRNWVNGRVQTIYGGTTEVIKEPIRRSRPALPADRAEARVFRKQHL